jgi:2'-5' RNA ligase
MAYRYYIGLRLPPAIRKAIETAQQELFDETRMIAPLEPHITLLPPPFVERIPPAELTPALKAAAAQFLPITVTLTRVDALAGRAIFIDVAGDELHALREALIMALPDGLSKKDAFHPHITLAQAARRKRLPDQLRQAYQARLATLLPCSMTVPQLTLFRWQKPRTYTAEEI